MVPTLCRIAFALVAVPSAVQAYRWESSIEGVTGKAALQVKGASRSKEWETVHDIDMMESSIMHKAVRTEETCESCYQGDILPPVDDAAGVSLMELWSNMSAAKSSPWPDGIVYYRYDANMAAEAKQVTEQAMLIWQHKTCVKFVEAPPESECKERVQCRPVNMGSSKPGCNAHQGYYSKKFQSYNLGEGCWHVGVALHELGHVLGLGHEHERFDRDDYVTAVPENVPEGLRQWFKLNPWRSPTGKQLPYDLSSIMHYDAWAFVTSPDYSDTSTASLVVKTNDPWGNCKMGQRSTLSIGDVLTVADYYGCPGEDFCADRASKAVCEGLRSSCGDEATKTKCPATCGVCTCTDSSSECGDLVQQAMCPWQSGGTAEKRAWMEQNCRKTCGICGPSDISCQDKDCVDGYEKCHPCSSLAGKTDKRSGRPYCEYDQIQMSCPRSCNACPAQVFC